MGIYGIKATNAALTTWTSPTTLISPGNVIDPFVYKFGSTYQLWFRNVANSDFLEMSTSSTPLGTYAATHTGNWTGIGAVEGPFIIQMPDLTYRVYACYLSSFYKYVTTAAFVTFGSIVNTVVPPGRAGPLTLTHGQMLHLTDVDQIRTVLTAFGGGSFGPYYRVVQDPGQAAVRLGKAPSNTRNCYSLMDGSSVVQGEFCRFETTGEIYLDSHSHPMNVYGTLKAIGGFVPGTTCSGQASGSILNTAGVLSVCP